MVLTMPFTEIRSVLYMPFQRIKEKVCHFIHNYLLEFHVEEAMSDILTNVSLSFEIEKIEDYLHSWLPVYYTAYDCVGNVFSYIF